MKIEKTQKTGRVGPLNRIKKAASTAPVGVTETRNLEDTVSILGIPQEEMTPHVKGAIMQLVDEVNRLRDELNDTKKRIGELAALADEDSLVSAVNRRAFVRELTRIISFSERYGAPCSLLYFDLNDLKVINDTMGHAAGDAALTFFADCIIANIRDSDVIGRVGGDEFAVILLNSDEEAAQAKAEQLEDYLENHSLEWKGQTLHLKAAYGVVSFRPGIDAGAAMAEADRAMYEKKKNLKTKT